MAENDDNFLWNATTATTLLNFTANNSINHTLYPPKTIFGETNNNNNNNNNNGGQGSLGVFLLAMTLVLLSLLLFLLVLYTLRRQILVWVLRPHHQGTTQQQQQRESLSERHDAIEEGLISKRVLIHDDVCEFVLRAIQAEKKLPNETNDSSGLTCDDEFVDINLELTSEKVPTTSISSDDEKQTTNCIFSHHEIRNAAPSIDFVDSMDQLECPICMAAFVQDEIVSWSSASASCFHAFHHECIKEWLARQHGNCPSCREPMLASDVVGKSNHLKGKQQSTLSRIKRSKLTFFCVQHGLLELPSSLFVTNPNMVDELEGKVQGPFIQKAELIQLRSDRHERIKAKNIVVQESDNDVEQGMGANQDG
jgi:hypothetical protein